MKILIVEDEKPAADKLVSLIQRYDPGAEILDTIASVEASIAWFIEGKEVADIIFMDIRLSDGLCFEIFQKVSIQAPVIFTTAYNEYALEAFKVNSIDYLLKPFSYENLYQSMEKLKSLRENLADSRQRLKIEELNEILAEVQRNYKTRFMIKVGEHIRSIKTEEIDLFFAEGRDVFILTSQGRQYIIDYKLEDLTEFVDPEVFFRINRTYIVNINAISEVIMYSNSRLKVRMVRPFTQELIIARDKVGQFKSWFGRE